MGNEIDTKFTLPVQPVQPGFAGQREERSSEKRVGSKNRQSHQKRKNKHHQKRDDRLDAYA